MPALFALTLFLSAALLFVVQPFVGKLLLPHWGGTPAVWNTCLVFFQIALLAGYAFAHWSTRWLGVRRQMLVQLALIALAFLALPIALPTRVLPDSASEQPVRTLLVALAVMVGLPFFVVATSGPVLQRWFAATRHRDAGDPYFLYAASNLGSFAALVSYPFLIEPNWTLSEQSRWWLAGYGLLFVLFVACATIVHAKNGEIARSWDNETRADPDDPSTRTANDSNHGSTGSSLSRLTWLLLAAIPSALLVSVTNYLTTDIAAVPLLWVLPLALYLLSFVLAFARWQWMPRRILAAALPILVLIVLFALLIDATEPAWLLLPAHLVVMFVAAWVCHGELARRRPPVADLTRYYLVISLGGALGGMASALAAPLLFRAPGMEYALILIAACAAAPSVRREPPRRRWRDPVKPIVLGLVTTGLVLAVQQVFADPGRWATGVLFGGPLVVAATLMDRPRRFALGLLGIVAANSLFHGPHGPPLVTERNFFGVVRVTREPDRGWHRLVHGNTVHGRQAWIDGQPQPIPLTYYHPTGPAGQLFTSLGERIRRVANCGLGTGALAYYSQPGQEWTQYEIDPAVVRVAQDPTLFTFLRDARAQPQRIALGDARLQLRHAPDGHYDLIVVDCFSSDAIPVHLLTREALALYLQKLAPRGVIAFHISNRYLDLRPVLRSLADDAGLEVCRVREDTVIDDDDRLAGKEPSAWAVLARTSGDLGRLKLSGLWVPADRPRNFRVWTDDYSHLWGVFKWW